MYERYFGAVCSFSRRSGDSGQTALALIEINTYIVLYTSSNDRGSFLNTSPVVIEFCRICSLAMLHIDSYYKHFENYKNLE